MATLLFAIIWAYVGALVVHRWISAMDGWTSPRITDASSFAASVAAWPIALLIMLYLDARSFLAGRPIDSQEP